MSNSRVTHPAPDEVEVSIFGPGKGESIAVHIGGGEWIIVDSCVDQVTKRIPVLQYLEGLGVDVSTAVRLVVGTHSHDDHISGLADIYEACSSAYFICSSALTREEFLQGVRTAESIESRLRQSIRSEYRKIFQTVKTRPLGKRMKHAIEGLELIARPASKDFPAMSVTALSPSHEAVGRATDALARNLVAVGDDKRISGIDPNELAVALMVIVGDTGVLLGADLLVGPAGCGWEAVLASFDPGSLASVFKVPHHGSPTSHHDDVWTNLLVSKPISLLAPFRPCRRPLPAPEDVARLKGLSSEVWCSANPKPPAPGKDVRNARASLSTLAVGVRSWGVTGQVQARRKRNAAKWEVTAFRPALQL